jgi:hypothetical protein
MSLTVKHSFASTATDDPAQAASGEILPSHWNESHTVSGPFNDVYNVKDAAFGAYGDGIHDDTAAIQAAINALPARGGTVYFPGGTYNVSSAITVGDGDHASTVSTKNGIKLVGQGAGYAMSGASVPTLISWTGASSSSYIFTLNGRISDCSIAGMQLGCAGNCNGISANSFSGCVFERIEIQNPKQYAISIGAGSAGFDYNIFNYFRQIFVTLSTANSVGLYMDGGSYGVNNNDTWISVFEGCRFETEGNSSSHLSCTGIWLKFVDNCTFVRCHSGSADGSNKDPTFLGVVFDALANDTYPTGVAFYDCAIENTSANEDGSHHIGVNYFYGFGTTDNEVVPTHANLRGVTDQGLVFNKGINFADITITSNITLGGGIYCTAFPLTALGAANARTRSRYLISDSSVPASGNFGATASGSGSYVVPVYSDGTNWIIG